ncbi:hypothetical protein L6164_009327 [Bauhinia variegata]|uniref:Uncharacterized protein n=1 Tax=Bauhinia variegata TaxID=167791 RepID=A0ACB9PJR6_BAUVA|nr:hypothetical protein L6164_009327 [Bauhinia variegata]
MDYSVEKELDGLQAQLQRMRCLNCYVDEGSNESKRYYLSRRTVLEMLRDRGFAIPSSEIGLSLSDFRSIHGEHPDIDSLRFSATHAVDTSKRILVVFSGPGIIKVNVIRSTLTQITNRDTLTGLIFVLQNRVTSQALKAINLFPVKIELFQITDLLGNITKHVLKPKHVVLTEKEKQDLLKKYNIEQNQLPRMLQNDAMARYYGLERGQVVKITYSGEITQMHVTYRCVW